MYIVTDIDAIAAAFDSAAPRSVEAIHREAYPDATIDAQGRAHAPHDGYETEDGQVFRGGEYLPDPLDAMDELAAMKQMMRGSYRPTLRVIVADTREELVFEGTKGQVATAREVAKDQQEAFDATRTHVLADGERGIIEARVMMIFDNFGEYGTVYTHLMRDADLNPVVYKGGKKLAKRGETVKVKATVKHWQRDDRLATYIKRPAAVKEAA